MSDKELQQIQDQIEERLRDAQPDVELLSLEQAAAERLRLVIDREEGGVDLELCESVTRELRDLNEEWALEVSSPGPERPLTKPEHFQRYVGHRVRVRTNEDIEGQKSFTGELTGADAEAVVVDPGNGEVSIPLAAIHRSNLMPDAEEVAA